MAAAAAAFIWMRCRPAHPRAGPKILFFPQRPESGLGLGRRMYLDCRPFSIYLMDQPLTALVSQLSWSHTLFVVFVVHATPPSDPIEDQSFAGMDAPPRRSHATALGHVAALKCTYTTRQGRGC